MKLTVSDSGDIQLEEVYNPILLIAQSKDRFAICMRDDGFEFSYKGDWYEAKGGEIRKIEYLKKASDENEVENVDSNSFPDLKNLNEFQTKFLKHLKMEFSNSEIRFVRGERILIDGKIVPGLLCNPTERLPYDIFLHSNIQLIHDMMKI